VCDGGLAVNFDELKKAARAGWPEMYVERPRVAQTHTVTVRDSANFVDYTLLTDHGTVAASVHVSTYAKGQPTLNAVMTAFAALVPMGDALKIRWVPCPMGDRPHTRGVLDEIKHWQLAQGEK
jgi:hypothetical protein